MMFDDNDNEYKNIDFEGMILRSIAKSGGGWVSIGELVEVRRTIFGREYKSVKVFEGYVMDAPEFRTIRQEVIKRPEKAIEYKDDQDK